MHEILRRAPPLTALLIAPALVGCRPEPAPETLDDLCGYIYAHFDDEDPEQLVEAMSNLDGWLNENIEVMTEDGYEITNLDQATIDEIQGEEGTDTEGLVGAALAWVSEHEVEEVTEALIFEEQMEVFPDIYNDYSREFLIGPDCYADGSCDLVDMENATDSSYAGLLDISTVSRARIRRFEMEQGTAALHQTWMAAPAEVNVDWLDVEQQYYVRIMLPQPQGHIRVQALWTVTEIGDASMPEGAALSLVLGSLNNQSELLDAFITENY